MNKTDEFLAKSIGTAFYALAAAALVFYFWLSLNPLRMVTPLGRVVLLSVICLLMHIGARLIAGTLSERHRLLLLKSNLAVWFGLYLLLLITMTLFDDYFGRGSMSMADWNMETFRHYMKNSFNLLPFATVADMFIEWMDGRIGARMFLYNIFGNLAALMPTALFLPLLFPRQRESKIFLLTVTGMVLVIEVAQFATLSGSFDIDDLILNVGGAYLAFAWLRACRGWDMVTKMFLPEQA